MNVGYSNRTLDYKNEVDDEVCPLCGSDIYISKYQNDYSCTNKECILFYGAKHLTRKIAKILEML